MVEGTKWMLQIYDTSVELPRSLDLLAAYARQTCLQYSRRGLGGQRLIGITVQAETAQRRECERFGYGSMPWRRRAKKTRAVRTVLGSLHS